MSYKIPHVYTIYSTFYLLHTSSNSLPNSLFQEAVATSYVSQEIVDALCSFSEASAFRRVCLSVMAISLSNEERAEVHKAFLEIDKAGRGG